MKFSRWIVPGIVALLIIAAWARYNGLNRSEMAVDVSWPEIDNQLMHRADLASDLVRVANGIAAHEVEIINSVTNARSRLAVAASRKERINAGIAMEGALLRLLVTMENYPQLKADQGYIDLMGEIAETENGFAAARSNYNTSAGAYNLKLRAIPTTWIASVFNFESRQLFEIPEEESAKSNHGL